MNDPRLRRGLQRLSNLLGDGQAFIDGNRSLLDPIREGGTLDQTSLLVF